MGMLKRFFKWLFYDLDFRPHWIRSMHLIDVFLPYVHGEEIDQFAKWAFGDNFATLQGVEFMEAWNALHKDKLTLNECAHPSDDAPRMVELWRSK